MPIVPFTAITTTMMMPTGSPGALFVPFPSARSQKLLLFNLNAKPPILARTDRSRQNIPPCYRRPFLVNYPPNSHQKLHFLRLLEFPQPCPAPSTRPSFVPSGARSAGHNAARHQTHFEGALKFSWATRRTVAAKTQVPTAGPECGGCG